MKALRTHNAVGTIGKGRFSLLRVLALVPVLLVPGCTDYTGGTGGSEDAVVSNLAGKGFTLVADGRGTEAGSAMRFAGSPVAVVSCAQNGRAFPSADLSKSITTSAGLKASQTGHVDAYLVISNEGALSGLYSVQTVREVRAPSGKLAGREIDTVEFAPGASGRFRNGMTCGARS